MQSSPFLRISDILRHGAVHHPGAPALLEDGRTWSYAELARETDAYAALLRDLDVRAGDRVMLVAENSVAQVALLFAAAVIDAWSVCVNARLSEGELATIAQHSGARRVLYLVHASPDAAGHAARAGATGCAARPGILAGPCNEACLPEPVDAGAAHVAALVYTTGTTGQPKGVMLSHASLLFVAATSSRLRGLTPDDRAYGGLPISHVYGLTSVLLGTLYAGACLLLAPHFDAARLLAAIRAGELTIVQGVPAMYARLLALAEGEGKGEARPVRSTLRFCYAGGSPLDPALKGAVEALFGLPLHNGYGLSETAPTVSQTRLDAPRADTSVGMPIPGVAVRIVGKQGLDVAPGEAGELWVRGPNLMRGYYRDAAATEAALRPGGWLATGDLARQGPDGALFLLGRTKELIIRSGFNVYPVEVETALNAHPNVVQSAVIGRPLPDGEEEVIAFVEARGVSGAVLADWLRPRLAPYKRPARIVFMDAMPAAPSGKILKSRLPPG